MDDFGNLVAKIALRSKLIDTNQYDQVARAYREAEGRKPYGAILLESGLLSGGALTRLLHDHRRAASQAVEDLISARLAEKKYASPDTLKECRRVVDDMRGKGFDFDLLELLLKRNAISQDQAAELRGYLRTDVFVCPLCLHVLRRNGETGPADCPECREELAPGVSDRLMDSVIAMAGMLPTTPAPAAEVPPQLGPYRVVREVGRGGMAVVYEAEDTRSKKTVALKILRSNVTLDHAYLARFHKEAEILERLDHPHIVRLHGVGQSAGFHYYAMDYVDGQGLDKLVHECRLNLKRTATWIRDVARALQSAHDRGIIHRDVKPGNILLDSSGHVVLTDFGLAHRERSNKLTVSGLTVGTPNFMSPEQARGERSKIDHRTDIYSLGTTFYNLATGRVPFPGNTPEIVVQQILNKDPKPPSQINHDVDPALETLILRAIEKDPQRRYPTAAAMADDLDRWLGGTNIEMKAVGIAERAEKWWGRHRAVLAAAAASLAVGLGTGLILTRVEHHRGAGALYQAQVQYTALQTDHRTLSDKYRDIHETMLRQQEGEVARAKAAVRSEMIGELDKLKRQVGDLENQVKLRDSQLTAEQADQLLVGLRAIRDGAEHLDAVGSELLHAGEAAGAALLFRRAREEVRRLTVWSGSYPEAVRNRLREVAEYRDLVAVEPRLANLHRKLEEAAAREVWARWIQGGDLGASLAAAAKTAAEFPGGFEPLFVRGLLNLRADRTAEAAADFREALAARPEDPRPQLGLAEIKLVEGRFADAKLILEKIPAGPGRDAEYARILAACLLGQRRFDEAMEALPAGGAKPTAELLALRARVRLARGEAGPALEDARQAAARLAELEAAGGRQAALLTGRPALPFEIWSCAAEAALALGRKAEAREAAYRALAIRPADAAMLKLLKEAGE